MTFNLHNPGDHAVTVYSAGCDSLGHFDLIVERDGREVWRLSRHAAVCGALIGVTLEPGEQETFGDTWGRRDNDGQPVSPGVYTVSGVVKFGLTEEAITDFELKPEPQEFEVS